MREVETGKASKVEIAKKNEIPRSTLSTYIRNKRTIEDAYEAGVFAHDKKKDFTLPNTQISRRRSSRGLKT